MFQIGHVSLTSADAYHRDSYCLARVFQKLPFPPKQYGVFDVFRDFQIFFELENLGSHLAMCPDDRFLPQGKQILPEICQVRPIPKIKIKLTEMFELHERILGMRSAEYQATIPLKFFIIMQMFRQSTNQNHYQVFR